MWIPSQQSGILPYCRSLSVDTLGRPASTTEQTEKLIWVCFVFFFFSRKQLHEWYGVTGVIRHSQHDAGVVVGSPSHYCSLPPLSSSSDWCDFPNNIPLVLWVYHNDTLHYNELVIHQSISMSLLPRVQVKLHTQWGMVLRAFIINWQ